MGPWHLNNVTLMSSMRFPDPQEAEGSRQPPNSRQHWKAARSRINKTHMEVDVAVEVARPFEHLQVADGPDGPRVSPPLT